MKNKPTKIIALMPFKNEEAFLPTFFHNILPVVDEVICIDDGSTDNSLQTIDVINSVYEDQYGLNKIKVYRGEDIVGEQRAGWPEIPNRIKLFNLARDHGGTHFVCLDADETFTNNFLANGRSLIEMLTPGERIQLRWLSLWGSTDHIREDRSIWTHNYGIFIEADDGKSLYDQANDGSGMHTPRCISTGPIRKFNIHQGAVLHYQFSYLNTFYLKQAWYRCSELIIRGKDDAEDINLKYAGGLDSNATLRPLPPEWVSGIPVPDYPNFDPEWKYESFIRGDYLDIILNWMDEHGAEYFEELNIWHVPQLYQKFMEVVGREPQPLVVAVPQSDGEFHENF